jgi:hypothetical protein
MMEQAVLQKAGAKRSPEQPGPLRPAATQWETPSPFPKIGQFSYIRRPDLTILKSNKCQKAGRSFSVW